MLVAIECPKKDKKKAARKQPVVNPGNGKTALFSLNTACSSCTSPASLRKAITLVTSEDNHFSQCYCFSDVPRALFGTTSYSRS